MKHSHVAQVMPPLPEIIISMTGGDCSLLNGYSGRRSSLNLRTLFNRIDNGIHAVVGPSDPGKRVRLRGYGTDSLLASEA